MRRTLPPVICLAGALLVDTTVAQPSATVPPPPPPVTSDDTSRVSALFWNAVAQLGLVMQAMGSLSGGGLEQGELWRVDLATGERRRIGQGSAFSWPVAAPDNQTVYVLRDERVVRIAAADGTETPLGQEVGWRTLLGVQPDGTVLGFVVGRPRVHPTLLAPDGTRTVLPQPVRDDEQSRAAVLLQEDRDYENGRRLQVRRSERGGLGFDVWLLDDGHWRNLTDCGNAACGEPSLTPDGRSVLYVRTSG
jgi:hypothetical protein